jgi:NhaA family Na+:H+ antiporter
MATDIAFALGILMLFGSRVPVGLKVFLAALAIVDDLGAVLVIALFYSSGLDTAAIIASGACLAVAVLANVGGVRHPWAYAVIGIVLWLAVLRSGVHATVAGVLLALAIPVRTRLNEAQFMTRAREALADFERAAIETARDPDVTVLSNADHHAAIEDLETAAERAQPPLIRMEHALHGVVAFAIMPLFALANAGVGISMDAARAAIASPVTPGIVLGLLLGKPLGIVGFSWLAVRLRLAALPVGVNWPMIAGAGMLGGIGFTMALFIAGLAFTSPAMLDLSKLAILAASMVAGVTGWMFLRLRLPADGRG